MTSSQQGTYYLDMKDYLNGELKKKLLKYNIEKKDLLFIDPYYLSKYLNSNEKIKDFTQFLRHLLQYTYRASINEVVNEYELKEVNKNLHKIEMMIKKLLKAQGIDETTLPTANEPSEIAKNESIQN